MIEGILLAFLLFVLVLLAFHTVRVRAGKSSPARLRPVRGMQQLAELVERSAETGRPLHVSVGVAGVGGASTAETWAGLSLLRYVADEVAAHGVPLIVTVADATALPIVQDIVHQAYAQDGIPGRADPTQVRFIAPDAVAYAAGTMGLLAREPLAGNVMVGAFGEEVLLISETGVRHDVQQVVGTADPRPLPLIYLSADEILVGEEIFAAGAWASGGPIQVASLLTEDWIRWAVIAAIVVLTIWKVVS